MMTKDEHNLLLEEIARTGGDTENMMKLIEKLQGDFDEREGELARYRETYDRENRESNPQEDYKTRYESLRKDYIDRFFGRVSNEIAEAKENVIERTEDDTKANSEPLDYDELFERKEGE